MYLIIKQSHLGITLVNNFYRCRTSHRSTFTCAGSGINPICDTITIYSLFIHIWGAREIQSVD